MLDQPSIGSEVSFNGQVAIVTGAGRGLGRAYALELARRGAAVVVSDNGTEVGSDIPLADLVVREIQAQGGRAAADISSIATPGGGLSVYETAMHNYGRLDVVINNAGFSSNCSVAEATPEEMLRLFEVHVLGALYVTQPSFQTMCAKGYGRILFTSSGAGLFGRPGAIAYGTAKAAVVGMMNMLALEGSDHGVRVNSLIPMALAEVSGSRAEGQKAILQAAGPQGANLNADYVVPLVTYLCSDACTTTQGIYSAIGGHYAQVHLAKSGGWTAAAGGPPSCEDIARNFATIRRAEQFVFPKSTREEVALVGGM